MPTFNDILVTLPLNPDQKRVLENAAPNTRFTYKRVDEIQAQADLPYDAIMGSVPVAALKNAPRLKWLQLGSAGAEGYRDKGALPAGAVLTCATGAYGLSVAEHAFAMMFALIKKLHLYRDNQHERLWQDEGPIQSLQGSTVLILGTGDIGESFAAMVKPFGTHIIGIRRTHGVKSDLIDEQYTLDQLDQLLPKADIILLSLPGTQETVNLITADRFRLMKNKAILLNIGRGSCIDTDALCDAVTDGQIFAAGIDVTSPEPLPSTHRIWAVKNILITPHSSGGFHMKETLERILKICLQNLALLAADKQPINIISSEFGYAIKTSPEKGGTSN